jgi:transposase
MLFMADAERGRRAGAASPPRLVRANRQQIELRPFDLESLLEPDHRARAIWAMVEGLDLAKFYEPIVARGSEPGRPAIDPKILVALWLYATSEGVGSARELARLCTAHDAYRWLCGGVAVNHHTLSDFRVGHEAALDALLTQVLAAMLHRGLVKLERVAHDGMRVRASAGASSFRREPSLRACLAAAEAQVAHVKQEAEHPVPGRSAREQAAAARAARERAKRVRHALAELPAVQAVKTTAEKKAQARVSTTDPEARVMKMGDGGFRPAYNVQLATTTDGRAIVGVQVTNGGSDQGRLEPMVDEIAQRTGTRPAEYLVDGGFVNLESITAAAAQGVTVYAPVPEPRAAGIDRYVPKADDPPAVAAWRERMGTEAAKAIYKDRAATAETTNADCRTHRGLNGFNVRGQAKVLCVALWTAVTYNALRWIAAGSGT